MIYPGLVYLIIFVVLTALTIILQPKPKTEKARPKGLGDFSFPTATEDRAVPIAYGTVDITGPNVLWYGDLSTADVKKKVGKKKQVVAFRYFVGMDLLLCYGPIDRIVQLEVGEKLYPNADISPTLPLTPGVSGTSFVLSDDNFLGGEEKGGTIAGTFTAFSGGDSPVQSAYLLTQLGADIPGYVNIAHVVAEHVEVGESANIQPYVFRISRFPDQLGLTGSNHIANGTEDDGDANPMEVLFDILTSAVYGLNIPVAQINTASFVTAGNTLADEGNGLSMVLTSKQEGLDIIQEISRQCDAAFFVDSSGNFCVRLIRDDYTPAALPLFDETNISNIDDFSRVGWSETVNSLNISFLNRDNRFQESGAPAQDLANVRTQGREVRSDFTYPYVKDPTIAELVAERDLRSLSFPLAKVIFTTNRDGEVVVPGDPIRFSWPDYGIVQMIIRVMSVVLGNVDKGTIKITGTQDMFRISETLYAEPNPTDWVAPDSTPAAFGANEELVREAPRILMNLYPDDIVDPTEARIWDLLRRPVAQPSTLNAEIFVDDSGGAGFIGVYGTANITPFATLDAAYSFQTADIETGDLLGIDLEVDITDLNDEVAAQLADGYNLVLIEGATQALDEVIGFETLVDDGDGTFTLRNVHRGLLDTHAQSHANGARLWFFAEGLSLSDVTWGDTQAISVKNIAVTNTGKLPEASASANALTFAQRTLRPHHPANGDVNSTRFPLVADEAIDLTIAWEHRLNADLTVRDADDGDATGQDTDVEYDVTYHQGVTGTEIHADAATGGLSASYTRANGIIDSGEVGNYPLEVRIQARYKAVPADPANPANLKSLQYSYANFNWDLGGATVQSVDFNGTDENLANTTHVALGFTDTYTINVWAKGDSNAGGTAPKLIVFAKSGDSSNKIQLSLTDDSDTSPWNITLRDFADTVIKDFDFGSYTSGSWTMITIVLNGSTLTVYEDGVEDTSPTKNVDIAGVGMTDTTRRTFIGSDTTSFFDGKLFSPAVWNSALASAEILKVFQMDSTGNVRDDVSPYVSSTTLVHLWDQRDTTDIGADFQNDDTGVKIDVDVNASNIDGTDLDGDVPT